MKERLDKTGLKQVLESVNKRITDSSTSTFATDTDWEVASLAVLESWVAGTTAIDTINSRTVNNYDVYLVTDTNTQYYFDSGVWLEFGPKVDLSNYFTKDEATAAFATAPLSKGEIDILLEETGFPVIDE